MKYYLIAGERSGDLHGANLMQAIQEKDAEAEFRFFGGDAMQKVGGELVLHYKEIAFMGFITVVKNLYKIKRIMKKCQVDILNYQPDLLILIDYGGFNLRMAKFAKKNQIKNFYYISPKVWAWNTKRAYKIKDNVNEMFSILPFEVDFFKKFDYHNVHYVGNPLLDETSKFEANPNFRKAHKLPEKTPIIALLPGSRKQEVKRLLPEMLKMPAHFPDYHFVIGGVNQLEDSLYQVPNGLSNVDIIFDQTYDLLSEATTAIVTSGTATLETALFNIPQVVVYKADAFSYAIGSRLLKIEHFSLVNLVAGRGIVTELLQKTVTEDILKKELKAILPEGENYQDILKEYAIVQEKIGKAGASQRAGYKMVELLKSYKTIAS